MGIMVIKGGNVITPQEILYETDIKISNGKILEIGSKLCDKDEIIASGQYVCPGFVDIHTHGGGGGDFMDCTNEAFSLALASHARLGTTSVVPTSVTSPISEICAMLDYVREFKNKGNPVCRVLGAHIEGPYLSLKNKGAQNEKYLLIPSRDSYSFITDNADCIKSVTISPELDGAEKMAWDLKSCGITVCGGHDDGEKALIMPVIDAGLSHCTHLWCAMSGVRMIDGIRKVGLTELGLSDDRLTAEVIADNHHMVPEMIKIVYRCKGADKMCVVSDSLRAGGMDESDKLYDLGAADDENGIKFIVYDGVARLPDKSRYAGSIQFLSTMVKNLVHDCNIPLVDAVKCASLTPARIVHAEREIGSVTVGKNADFCFLNEKLEAVKTIVNGKIIYER